MSRRSSQAPGVPRGLSIRLFAARVFETIEQAWPHLFPVVAVVAVFVALAWLNVWSVLPIWLHWAGLAVALAALLGSLVIAWRGIRPASRVRAMQRLERDSRLRHGPIGALEDRLPEEVTDPLTRRLWERHRQNALARLEHIRIAPPRSQMPRIDPWAGRAALGLLLVIAAVEGRGEWGPRLVRAVMPSATHAAASVPIVPSLWITPPAYTSLAPIGAERTAGANALHVPAGSDALLQIHGLPADEASWPVARFAGEVLAIEQLGDGSGQVEWLLETPGDLVVALPSAGAPPEEEALHAWAITIEPDQAPTIAFVDQPRPSLRATLEVGFEATDDHGLVSASLAFARSRVPPEGASVPSEGASEEPAEALADEIPGETAETAEALEFERIELLAPAGSPKSLATSSHVDLSAHPLAGLPVTMHLEATDALGQVGRSGAIEITLPERVFTHPLARAVIAIRKDIVASPYEKSTPARKLTALGASEPAQSLGMAVPLALTTAASRLREAQDPADRRSVVDLLWELALFIEDGRLSLAERELRELQDALQKALLEGADDAELERLMNELEQALDRFLEEMMRNALEQAQRMPEGMELRPMDPSQLVTPEDLDAMLDRARDLMRSGARDAARDMLAQMQRMLENLQTAMQQPMQPGPGEQAVSDLQRMIELQQNLLDRSFQMQNGDQGQQQPGQDGREGQRGDQQGRPQGGTGQAAAEQEALRRALGELMRRMGEAGMDIPRALGQAEMQMRGARDSLQQGEPGEAAGPQGQAIDLMQQGGQAMMEQLREMMAQQPGQGGMPARAERQGRDPLGRSTRNDGGVDSEGTEIPAENDLGRARGVLEELYRRSRDRTRPPVELDYFDRLLDRF